MVWLLFSMIAKLSLCKYGSHAHLVDLMIEVCKLFLHYMHLSVNKFRQKFSLMDIYPAMHG